MLSATVSCSRAADVRGCAASQLRPLPVEGVRPSVFETGVTVGMSVGDSVSELDLECC